VPEVKIVDGLIESPHVHILRSRYMLQVYKEEVKKVFNVTKSHAIKSYKKVKGKVVPALN
jgi:hypothetical protein